MNELKNEVVKLMNQVNQDWRDVLEEGKKSDQGPDYSDLFARYSQNMVDLDKVFTDYKNRQGKKKGGLFNF